MIEDDSISLIPTWYQRAWTFAKILGRTIFQISVFVAALTFLQRQEPLLDRKIDHGSKLLTISRVGISPLKVKIFAIRFDVNFVRDDRGHTSINSAVPINAIYTNGILHEETLWFPWSTMSVDLKAAGKIAFDDLNGEMPTLFGVYCLAIEARNLLSNQFIVEPVLTPKVMFPASAFGPIPQSGALGGGYPKDLLAAEALIKADCRTLYDKVR